MDDGLVPVPLQKKSSSQVAPNNSATAARSPVGIPVSVSTQVTQALNFFSNSESGSHNGCLMGTGLIILIASLQGPKQSCGKLPWSWRFAP